MAVILIWNIWKLRNNKIFRDENFNINGISVRVKRMMKDCDFRNEIILEGNEDKE